MNIEKIVEKQNEFYRSGMTRTYAFRKSMLDRLENGMDKYEDRIFAALLWDLNKQRSEAYMTEIGLAHEELRYCRRHLAGWMRDRHTFPTIAQLPAICAISPEPYGKVLIVSPWNYPVLLTMEPLIGAIAAGNCAVIKPSAYTPATPHVIAEMIEDTFPEKYITVVEGGREENKTLFDQDFDHIFFTGSVDVGRTVMEAASKHLTPVTLELGGKSPVIIDETADMYLAAKRVAFGKVINAGQTCVAPDYVLIQESVRDDFVDAWEIVMDKFFPDGDYLDMACIVNEKHYKRVTGLMEGQEIVFGGGCDGVYIYSQALSTKEAKAEANYIIKLIEPYRTYINMPVVMDYEYYSEDSYTGRLTGSKPSKATKTKAVLQFFKTVKAAGYSPMLYASRSFLVNSLKMSSIEGQGDIWLAEWKTSATTYTGDYSFWQWTDEGGIKGIKGNVDLNTWYTKDIDQYNRYYTGTVPTGLAQSSRDLTSNTMSWNKTTNAESYTLYRADTYPGTFKSVGTAASTSYKNTGLTSGREYYYKLTATGTAASDLTTVSKTSSKTSGYVRGYTKPGYTRTAKVKKAASIYSRPNTTEKVKAAKGAKLSVYCWTKDGDNATWYRVKYVKSGKSYYGYIKGTDVSITKTGTSTEKLNVRSGAGTSYKTITTIASGTRVTIKATRKDKSGGTWYKVKFTKSSKTYTGYVSASYIK